MVIKFIQVNIFKGKYLDSLIDFLLEENPHIISLQEVTVGEVGLYKDKGDLLEKLKNRLKMSGVFHSDHEYVDLKGSKFGNAVLSKFPILESKILELKKFRPVYFDEIEGSDYKLVHNIREQLARSILDATLNVGSRAIHALSWHGAWTAPPADTRETLRQARLVSNYLKNLDEPFLMGCDANNVPESKTVGIINKVSSNFMLKSGVKQTTHPEAHKIAPRGFLIDYIFASGDFTLKKLYVPQVLVSDHLPVVAEVEM